MQASAVDFEQHRPALTGHCYRMLGSPADADDAVQDFAMLLSEPFFKGFTPRQICDTSTHTEALVCISCGSHEEVHQMMAAVIAAGGKAVNPPVDHGFMYGASFYNLDGHHCEPMWMDQAAVQPQ